MSRSVVLAVIALVGAAAVAQVVSKRPRNELVEVYRNWTDDDVPWIITPEERTAFHQLSNDQERNSFIEQFWYRRDPTPDTLENEFEDEYYKRVLYSNEHFVAGGKPGWRTDRGRIYIVYGPPDSVESGAKKLADGATAKTELWRYKYLEGLGTNFAFDFADQSGSDDYVLELPDLMSELPPAAHIRDWPGFKGSLELYVGGVSQPRIQYLDLLSVLAHKVSYNGFPISLTVSAERATKNIDLARLSISVPRTGLKEGQIGRGEVRAFVMISDMTGRVVDRREAHVSPPADMQSEATGPISMYFDIPVFSGRYRLDLVVEDVETGFKKTIVQSLKVPGREE